MNTLEKRLREILAERAAHSPVDPRAWDKTVARSHRGLRLRFRLVLPRWLPAGLVIPAAAAAAVVAVVLAATTLTGQGRSAEDPGATSGIVWPPARTPHAVRDLLKEDPPITAVVSASLLDGGQHTSVFVWYTQGPATDTGSQPELCDMVVGGPSDGDGGCGGGPSSLAATSQHTYLNAISGTVDLGVTDGRAASVTARLDNGREVSGLVLSGRGFPRKVWLVSIPSADSAQLVFRDVAENEVSHLDLTANFLAVPRPRGGGIVVYRYPGDEITAYEVNGNLIFWLENAPPSALIGLPAPLSRVVAATRSIPGPVLCLGYARQDVSRVVVRAGGRQFTAQLVPGWPGSGIRLWGLRLPNGPATATAYGAAGQVLGQIPV